MMPASDLERDAAPADEDWIVGLAAPLAIVVDDGGGPRFSKVSAGFLHAMAWARAETTDRPLDQLFPLHARLILGQALRRVAEGGGPVEVVAPIRRSSHEVALISFALRSALGGVALEIASPAERRDGAAGWRRVLFQQLNQMGSGAACLYDRLPSAAMDLGAVLGFAGSVPPSEAGLIHPDDAPSLDEHKRLLAAASEGHIGRVTIRMRHADGAWRWIEIREKSLSRTSKDDLGQVLGLAIDVSEHYALLEAAQRQSLAVMSAEIKERRRLARELHDTMAQYLVVIDLALSRLQRSTGVALPEEPVEEIRDALRAAHDEVRSFSWLLHPPDLERLGLVHAIEKFGSGFGKRTGLTVVTEADELPPLSPAAELTLFRVAQEALMNVHRHAKATEVLFRLGVSSGAVSLDVIDNGKGLVGAVLDQDSGEGVGLSGTRARVERLSGTMSVLPVSEGFHLRVVLPVQIGLGGDSEGAGRWRDEGF